MGLQVIGAGVGRTGTASLRVALERLLGGRCYHMREVLQQPSHIDHWRAAVRGRPVSWDEIYSGYTATVDWPGAAFWRPLADEYPDALVLLSIRSSPAEWYESASKTIDALLMRRPRRGARRWHAMSRELVRKTFTPLPMEKTAAEAAYEQHNAEVRAAIPPERLLVWTAGDGWEPLCERLGLPVPDEPFPHLNTELGFTTMLEENPAGSLVLPRIRRWLRG